MALTGVTKYYFGHYFNHHTSIWQADILNYLSLGSFEAKTRHFWVIIWRNCFILTVGLLIGFSVALCSAISFVGLIVPHLLRLSGITHL